MCLNFSDYTGRNKGLDFRSRENFKMRWTTRYWCLVIPSDVTVGELGYKRPWRETFRALGAQTVVLLKEGDFKLHQYRLAEVFSLLRTGREEKESARSCGWQAV